MDKRLLLFSILYTFITIYFFNDIAHSGRAGLKYIFIFPAFWIVAGILLGLLYYYGKIKKENKWNIIGLIFSTPIPTLIFYFLMFVFKVDFYQVFR